MIGGICSPQFPKPLVAEMARPKPPVPVAKAPWAGAALPAPPKASVARLYL